MTSQLDVRLGVLEPQIVHRPPDVVSLDAATECIELADAYGICSGFPLDASQRFTLEVAMGTRADGSWAAATVADFEPRQNGKNDSIAARELFGLVLAGEELIIHTAHEFSTANESFLRLVAVFENWDDLRRRVARIRYANGEQGIELLSGQRLKYRARTGGAGRGFAKADLVVYDEAQHLKKEHVAASGPARLVNPNNQSWYSGSGGFEHSENAWRLRKRALKGNAGRLAYVEHTAEVVSLDSHGNVISARPTDILDRDAWATANPAYGWRVSDESFLSLYEELGPDLFARECLNLWDPEPGADAAVIPLGVWRDNADTSSTVTDRPAFAIDVSPDHAWASIAVAGVRPDGRCHVERVPDVADDPAARLSGTSWVVARCVELKKHKPLGFVIDPASPAAALIGPLKAAGVTTTPIAAKDHHAACGAFYDAASETKLAHLDQPSLAAALVGAQKRVVGDGAWVWDRRKAEVDITALVAVTQAYWLATRPKGRLFVGMS